MINDAALYSELSPYLHPGEEILWAGRPTVTKLASGQSKFITLFSIFFMGFSVFWMLMASMAGGPFFLFGLPFFGVGLGLFITSTVGQRRALEKSAYAVTDTRAIILVTRGNKGTSFTEYVFANLQSISLENVNGNVGTIRFESVIVHNYEYGRYNRSRSTTYLPERELTTGFIMIDDIHTVYHLISDRLGR